MFRKILAPVGAALLLSMAALTVNAATFDFTTEDRYNSSFTMNKEGIGLTVKSAYLKDNGTVREYGKLVSNSEGLGVSTGWWDSDNIDGEGKDELVIFEFSKEVKIDTIIFGTEDNDNEFTFFAGSPLLMIGAGYEVDAVWTLNNFINSMFGIGADSGHWHQKNHFTIKSMTVSAVPLPSSIVLFGGALLGIGWLSRRKMKAKRVTSIA